MLIQDMGLQRRAQTCFQKICKKEQPPGSLMGPENVVTRSGSYRPISIMDS